MPPNVVVKMLNLVRSIEGENYKMLKHAYLIIAHDNFWQLKILLRLLDDIRNDIFLFIDKKNIEKTDINDIRKSVNSSHMSVFSPFEINWGNTHQARAEVS